MTSESVQRLALVGRGIEAMRLLRASRELELETGVSMHSIAIVAEGDEGGWFGRDATEVVVVPGPPGFDIERLETALEAARADVVWATRGAGAARPELAALCAARGWTFIGPSEEALRRLMDPVQVRRAAEAIGVDTVPWSGGPVESAEQARLQARALGYPVAFRGVFGGWSKLWVVSGEPEIPEVFRRARSEAGGPVLMEHLIEGVRRIEVPVLCDLEGRRHALEPLDASLRHHGRTIYAESPVPSLSEAARARVQETALKLAEGLGQQLVGTMIFLFDVPTERLTFLGYASCCAPEHAVVEARTGLDLVKTHYLLGHGDRLPEAPPDGRGHAVTVALEVERDSDGPVKVEHVNLALGPGIRVDAGSTPGDSLRPPETLAAITGFASQRVAVISRLQRVMRESSSLVRNAHTTLGSLARLLESTQVAAGDLGENRRPDSLPEGPDRSDDNAPIALIEAAVEAYDMEHGAERGQFHAWAKRGRAKIDGGSSRRVELTYRGHVYTLEVRATGPDRYDVEVEGEVFAVRIENRRGATHHIVIGARRYVVSAMRDGHVHRIEIGGELHRILTDRGGVVRADAPAVVVSVHVAEGDVVAAGDRLAVLEAMKTELTLTAPFSGRVRQVMARSNVQVGPGAPLAWIEPVEPAEAPAGATRVGFDGLTQDLGGGSAEAVELFETLLMGYDVLPDALRLAIERYTSSETVRPELWPQEDALLRRFLALVALLPEDRAPASSGAGGLHLSQREYLRSYMMDVIGQGQGLPHSFVRKLRAALTPYGAGELEVTPGLLEALYRLHVALSRRGELVGVVHAILGRRLLAARSGLLEGGAPKPPPADTIGTVDLGTLDLGTVGFRELLDQLVVRTQSDFPTLCDAAREVRYAYFDGPFLAEVHQRLCDEAERAVDALTHASDEAAMRQVVTCPQSLSGRFLHSTETRDPARRRVILEAMTRRYYRVRTLEQDGMEEVAGHPVFVARYAIDRGYRTVMSWLGDLEALPEAAALLSQRASTIEGSARAALDLYAWRSPDAPAPSPDAVEAILTEAELPEIVSRVVLAVGSQVKQSSGWGPAPCFTFRRRNGGWIEDRNLRSMHPMVAERMYMARLAAFDLERVEAPEDIYAFVATGRENADDRRIVIYAEVRDLSAVRDEEEKLVALPQLERMVAECFTCVRRLRAKQPSRGRTEWNRVELFIWPELEASQAELRAIAHKIAPASGGLGLEKVRVNVGVGSSGDEPAKRQVLELSNPNGRGVALRICEAEGSPIPTLTKYEQKVIKLRRRGLVYPYEIIRHLTPDASSATEGLPSGEFIEHELDPDGSLGPVDRPPGQNKSNIIVGLVRSFTAKHPEGMTRVALLGDPSRAMGSLAEPECRRIIAALDLAERLSVPAEWYAVSAGAEISTERGTENMDWISAVLKRIIEYTQAGGELNIVVCGINVGAQPYWNAEATMLMHTKGVLIMLPEAAMVLTGKQALDYSGGVSAEDNLGIGGYDRVMGPNGQAQFIAQDVVDAGRLLLRYYEHSYRAPGERYPRRRDTTDAFDRDVCLSPHGDLDGLGFETVGQVFSAEHNPGRKRPFDIRRIMAAAVDQDAPPLERWRDMRDAETVVVWDAHLGGIPVSLLGFESRPIRRLGYVPADGPMNWTPGTLFPQSSKKAARAINAASGNRPLAILANLSGFDGSPESLRQWQLEYGAEIGRAIVNFDGPIVFCVVSRYHGGAFVVFSNRLNPRMRTLALDGTHASVIGGAPAAAVVFARELKKRVANDDRVRSLQAELQEASGTSRAWLSVRLKQTIDAVHSEKLGGLADEFDTIHSVGRAQEVGSVHEIIAPETLRPELIRSLEAGMAEDG